MGDRIAISGCRSLLESFEGTFFELIMVENCRWNFDVIYHSFRYVSISDLDGRIAISGCRSLTQSFGGTFIELVMVKNARIAVGISTLSFYHSYREISTSGLGGHIAISGCRSFSQSLSFNSPWSKTPGCSWKRTNMLFFYLNSWGLFYLKRNTCA